MQGRSGAFCGLSVARATPKLPRARSTLSACRLWPPKDLAVAPASWTYCLRTVCRQAVALVVRTGCNGYLDWHAVIGAVEEGRR
jgi:hypothetical protein